MLRGATRISAAGLLPAGLLAALLLAGCSQDETPLPTVGGSSASAPVTSSPSTSTSHSTSTGPSGSGGPSGSASASPEAPATTPVAPPSSGSTSSTVPSQKETKRKPVKLDAPSKAADGVKVQLTKVAAIKAKAVGPGEVSGPAVALTVTITNGTDRPVDIGSVVINVTAADQTPGSQMTGPPARNFSGSLKPGAKATGVYVYTVATTKRDPVTVEVTVRPADPVVVFRGRAAS